MRTSQDCLILWCSHRRFIQKNGGHSTPAARRRKIVIKAGPNTENIVQLASAGVSFPAIYAGKPPGVHLVD
jgi:hypothetical protein